MPSFDPVCLPRLGRASWQVPPSPKCPDRLAVKASTVAMGQKRESVRGPKGAGNSPFSCAQLQPLANIAPAPLWKSILGFDEDHQ